MTRLLSLNKVSKLVMMEDVICKEDKSNKFA